MPSRETGGFPVIPTEAMAEGLRVVFSGTADATTGLPNVELSDDAPFQGITSRSVQAGEMMTLLPLFEEPKICRVKVEVNNLHPGTLLWADADGYLTSETDGVGGAGTVACGIAVTPGLNVTAGAGKIVNCHVAFIRWTN